MRDGWWVGRVGGAEGEREVEGVGQWYACWQRVGEVDGQCLVAGPGRSLVGSSAILACDEGGAAEVVQVEGGSGVADEVVGVAGAVVHHAAEANHIARADVGEGAEVLVVASLVRVANQPIDGDVLAYRQVVACLAIGIFDRKGTIV